MPNIVGFSTKLARVVELNPEKKSGAISNLTLGDLQVLISTYFHLLSLSCREALLLRTYAGGIFYFRGGMETYYFDI